MYPDILIGAFWAILEAVPTTLLMALIILASGISLGALFAFVKIKKTKVLSQFVSVLVAYVRGTPMIVQLFLVNYSLPNLIAWFSNSFLGTDMKPFDVSSLIVIYFAYILNTSGYQCEVIRGALQSVEHGQMEAGYSIGMTEWQTMMRIIFPQALAVAIPSFLSYYMSLIKLLSLAFTLQVIDIMAASKLYSALTDRYTESYVAAALVYWIIGIGLTFIFNKWEIFSKKKLGVSV
ncbi:MAG: amino acid ABC transporter permease [Candidatus Avilachnospira sp.]|jgi:His/Glu/Gln/Arg/opine family amino acid ABC transporter permease subunit